MSKPTPGPWEIAPYNGIEIKFIVDKEDNLVADCWPYIDPYYRNANDRRYKNRKEPNEADARLIAAAPDLLEALQEIAQMTPKLVMNNNALMSAPMDEKYNYNTVFTAIAAIKKATGE